MSDSPQISIGNRQIAQFMRGKIVPETWTWHYHEDWNQVIIVAKKIKTIVEKENLKFNKVLGPCYSGMQEALTNMDIEMLWLEIIAFIHWYEESK